tara:strand:+ start:34 stop:675 length:642 start_codon:yes stop_codon:yes gene_type:complete
MIKLSNEPTTVFTDLAISFFGFYSANALQHLFNATLMGVHKYFSLYFLAIAFSAFFGALYHIIDPKYRNVRSGLWKITMIGMIFSLMNMLMATIFYSVPINDNFFKFLQIIIYFFSFILTVRIFINDNIVNAILIYFLSSIIVCMAMIFSWIHYNDFAALQIFIGILITLFGSSFVITKISFHKHFNHNDIFHIFQLIGMYVIFIGSIKIIDN